MTLRRLQEVLVDCLLAPDPARALDDALARGDDALTVTERAQLAGVDRDGLRLAALLAGKLRFESILRGGGAQLRRRFEEDPGGFTVDFERYVRAEPDRAVFPAEEARRFRAFCSDS